jgi:hypothetical protein
VVVLLGSDLSLLDQTIANLEAKDLPVLPRNLSVLPGDLTAAPTSPCSTRNNCSHRPTRSQWRTTPN